MRGFTALKGQGANPRVFCLVMEIAFFQESGVKRCPKRQLSLLLFQYVPQRKRNPTAARMEKVTIAGVNPYRPIFRIADSSPLTLHSFAMAPARMMALARNPPRSIMEPRSTFFILLSADWYIFMRPVSCYRHDLHGNTAETIFLRELFGKSPRPASLTVRMKMKGCQPSLHPAGLATTFLSV